MEKDHNTGKCCFCNRKHTKGEKGPSPTIFLGVAIAKLIFKSIMTYYLFEALYKVHT